MARELEENMSEEELRAMIEEFDTDNDGESEFHCSVVKEKVNDTSRFHFCSSSSKSRRIYCHHDR